MLKMTRSDAPNFKNSNTCHVEEYDVGDAEISFAIIKISGRYPDHGRVTNTQCKELAYVQEGSGKIIVEGKEVALNPGDMILLDKEERFYWEGNMTLHITCTPAFAIEQHLEVA